MIFLIILAIITYLRSLTNGFISDDVTMLAELKKQNWPVRPKLFFNSMNAPFQDLIYRICKDNGFLHHLVNMAIYTILVVTFYLTGCKFIPENVMFWAAVFFTVHPCNCQVAGWISGKWYMVSLLIALFAISTNQIAFYVLSSGIATNTSLVCLLIPAPWWQKLIAMVVYSLMVYGSMQGKINITKSEAHFKKQNLRINPRKLIVALKSFCYYFTLCLFPVRLGWFHEMGEPVDDKLRSFNFHAVIAVLLIATMFLFYGTPAFLGIVIFALLILPYSNIITPGLFTSERYMTGAVMGYSIFLAYLLHQWPIVAAIIATIYFMRTQIELWFYKDDFSLALYSLLNFPSSGFAWCNISRYLLESERPWAAYDMLKETERRIPEFPTTYYHLSMIHRSINLLPDFNKSLDYLEKACHYGKHENWFKELEDFKARLKEERIKRFLENVHREHPIPRVEPKFNG